MVAPDAGRTLRLAIPQQLVFGRRIISNKMPPDGSRKLAHLFMCVYFKSFLLLLEGAEERSNGGGVTAGRFGTIIFLAGSRSVPTSGTPVWIRGGLLQRIVVTSNDCD